MAIRRVVGDRIGGDRVDSRWWYWLAAIPLTFALWAVTVAWVAVAIALGPLTVSDPILRPGEISMVTFGVPFFVLTFVAPFAVYADVSAILDADLSWRPNRATWTAGAAVGPVVAIGAILYGIVTRGDLSVPLWGVVLGFLVAVPVAAFYLYRRHDCLGAP